MRDDPFRPARHPRPMTMAQVQTPASRAQFPMAADVPDYQLRKGCCAQEVPAGDIRSGEFLSAVE